MDSLINFDGLGEAVKTLINRLADGIGWIATRETPQKTAVNTYIEGIQNSNFDPIVKAALISKAKKSIKEYCNQNDIVNLAIGMINETAETENVPEDWLNQFMDRTRHVSDKEFQFIWAKVLAEECNAPGSMPKKLLHILEQIEKQEAEVFTKLCTVSVCVEDIVCKYTPMVIGPYLQEYYQDLGITYEALIELQALGLIEMDFGLLEHPFSETSEKSPLVVRYFDYKYEFPEGKRDFHTGAVVFTRAGQALCKSLSVEKQEGFWETICLPAWKKEMSAYDIIQHF